jgi:hypothetical protein
MKTQMYVVNGFARFRNSSKKNHPPKHNPQYSSCWSLILGNISWDSLPEERISITFILVTRWGINTHKSKTLYFHGYQPPLRFKQNVVGAQAVSY